MRFPASNSLNFPQKSRGDREELRANISPDEVISEISAVNGYLNFKIDKTQFAKEVLERIFQEKDKYGASDEGGARRSASIIPPSISPSLSISAPFHDGFGGRSVPDFKLFGYKAVGINHLGDYGTQFGKLISAYKRWGNKKAWKRAVSGL